MKQDEYTEYDRQADDFLTKYHLSIHAELLPFEKPPWLNENGVCGERYNVSISRMNHDDVLSFVYWSSYNDALEERRPNNYDVLTCVSSSAHSPTNAYEVRYEFGENMPLDQCEAVAAEAKRFQEFFSDEELADLAKIV